MRGTCCKGKAGLLSFEQTPSHKAWASPSSATDPSPSILILRRGVNFKRFYNYIMMLSIPVVGGLVQGGEGKEEVDEGKPTRFAPISPLPTTGDLGSGFMPLGDVKSALVMSPPSVPGHKFHFPEGAADSSFWANSDASNKYWQRRETFNGKAL